MAIAYETALAGAAVTFPDGGGSQTQTFDAGTGANRVLLVAVAYRDKDGMSISAVTYNGVSMTSAGTAPTNGTDNCALHLWYLAGPASGSNTIQVTSSGNSGSSQGQISAWVANGVDQTTPVSNYSSNFGSGSSANIVSSVTITSETNDVVAVFHATWNVSSNVTATPTNFTERIDGTTSAGLSTEAGDAAGAASVATSATWSNGAFTVSWCAVGVSVNPAASGATPLVGGGATAGRLRNRLAA